MPKYIITRTVEITTEFEAEDPREAYHMHLDNEMCEGEFNEVEVEIWDVTNEKKHIKVKTEEWNI